MMEFLAGMEATSIATWMRESPSIWAYPTVLALHTLGLGLIVGCSVVVDLRLLGAAPGIPLEPLERLFPIMWLGFAINAGSGVLLFVKSATTVGISGLFWTKIALIAASMIVLTRIRRTVFSRPVLASASLSGAARTLPLLSILLWAAAITAGRLLAYIGPTQAEAGVLGGMQ